MRWFRDVAFRIRALFTSRRMERELDEELRFHLDMETEKLVAQGVNPEEARRRALRRFGAPGRQRDRVRWAWGVTAVRDMLVDTRLVGRQLRRNPGFAIGAIITLALAIGANTAIFSVAERALLRKPPVERPDRLASVYTTCRRGALQCSSSYPDFIDYRDLSRSFLDMAASNRVTLNVGEARSARLATGVLITGNYFSLLGVRPAHGRLIQPADNADGRGESVAVLGHDFWRRAFGADPSIVGRTIRVNGAAFVVVGVGPEGFDGLDLTAGADLWLPMFSGPALGPAVGGASDPEAPYQRNYRWIGRIVGRLAPAATLAQARADMDGLAVRLGDQYPLERGSIEGVRGITVDPIGTYILPVGSEASLKRFVFLLVGVVALTLLLAAANLANLFLARATAREQEIGIRMAVGAGRSRVVRQLATESLALSVIGGMLGLGVAKLGLAAIGTFDLPGGVAVADLGVGLDLRVLIFALTISVLTALLFGLTPALQASRRDVVRSVKGDRSGRRGQPALRKMLVSVQVALCLVLLVGSGLFLRTLRNSLDADLGFDPARSVTARFNLSLLAYSEERGQTFVADLLREVRGLPGVTAASIATLVPFQPGGFRGTFAEIDGYVPQPDEEIRVDWVVVEPEYFGALGTRVLQGREFTQTDLEGAAPVVVINRHMADRYWSGRDAVGSRVTILGESVEVVGVVENPAWQAVGETPTPFVFVPQQQFNMASTAFLTLVARTDGDPTALLPQLRERFRAADSGLSLTYLRTMEDQVGIALMPQRMGTVLLSMLGLLALVLAAVGVYAVVSYTVKQQSRELGIRIAVGATGMKILRTVLAGMLVPVLAGLGLGAAAAFALSRTVETFLFGVSPADPTTFVAISVLLCAVALGATLIPARAASRLDLVKVLKTE